MDAVCLGILVADIFSSPVDSVPAAGELKLAERFLLSAGGCAVNTAACLRRLGREVRVLGKVGQDLFGDFVLRDLERLGIDASSIKRSQTHPTSGTFIMNVKGEDRRYKKRTGLGPLPLQRKNNGISSVSAYVRRSRLVPGVNFRGRPAEISFTMR